MDGAFHFVDATNQGIDPTFARLFIQVDAIGCQSFTRAGLFLRGRALFLALFRSPFDALLFCHAGALGHAMGDEVHRIIAGHVLFLQEVSRVALPLGEQGNQHIGTGHFCATGTFNMDDRALDNALEAGRWPRFALTRDDQIFKFAIDVAVQIRLEPIQINITGF